jgi:hypothetical protein
MSNFMKTHPVGAEMFCCIQRGPGGERIVDVVPGGTELEHQVKTGSWAGCTHSQ